MKKHFPYSGFTLIELSIVLVIIGLVIGGIVVGKSLIDVVRVQKTISQIETYKIHFRMFKDRFANLPGDIPEPKATNFFGDRVCNPWAGATWMQGGNGNGNIGRENGFAEQSMVWCQLDLAGIIKDGSYVTNVNGVSSLKAPLSVWSSSFYVQLPFYNNTSNNNCQMGSSDNCFLLSDCFGCASDSGEGISPADAMSFDIKADDGFPLSGNIRGIRSIYGGFSNADNCMANSSTNSYQLTATGMSCALTFKIN